jgi:transcriptional regulator of acetoin/glycerol metabolism
MSTVLMIEDPALAPMRAEVVASWERSAAAGVDVDQPDAPIALDGSDLRGQREMHPLSRVFPLLDDVLGREVRACGAVMALADADGNLLWVCGSSESLRQAERIGFVEGSNWDERLAGTNAPGLALATGREATITRDEHFRSSVRGWSCAATPIHDPGTSQLLGVLDVTGGDEVVVPQTMAMVRAAARLAEAELARHLPRPDVAPQSAQSSGLRVVLELLGRNEALVSVADGRDRTEPLPVGRPTRAKPVRDRRGFWRILLAVIVPMPMLAKGVFYILTQVAGDVTFKKSVASFEANPDVLETLKWFDAVFVVTLIPATIALAWVARRPPA